MHNSNRRVCGHVVVGALSYSKPSINSQQTSTLLAQTTGWLKQLLAAHARSVKSTEGGATLENHLEEIDFEPCTFNYRDVTSSHWKGQVTTEQVFTFTVPLSELDASTIRAEIQNDRPTLTLFTIDDQKLIKGTAWLEPDHIWKATTLESAYQSRVVIAFDSLATTKAVAKALKQTISLCQNRAPRSRTQKFLLQCSNHALRLLKLVQSM